MKKISVAAIVTVLVITACIIFLSRSGILKHERGANNIASGTESSAEEGNVSFGEYKYVLPEGDTVNTRYIKSGSTLKIYSVYPVSSKDLYDISSDGSTAVYVGKDHNLWALMNDGTYKKITPDNYGTIDKSQIEKQIPGYVWAEKPVLSNDGIVRFISNLPDTINAKKSIWEINISDSSMKKVYTPESDNYKYLGYRDDGRMMIADGQKLAAVNEKDGSIQYVDVKGKYILNMSPDGQKIIYAKESSKIDYSRLYMMDGYGKNNNILPGVSGYTGSSIGAWNTDSLEYAFVVKPVYSGSDKIAVISLDEDYTSLKTYAPESSTKFPDNSNLSWSPSGSVTIDTGSDFVNIDTDETTGGGE